MDLLILFYGEENPGSIAYNQIQGFKDSATSHGGFYIGRYEQGTGNVCKAGINPYVDYNKRSSKKLKLKRYIVEIVM